jgi:predicted nucleic acid-binding protein
MIYLLDSNVVSEIWKPAPAEKVMQFLDETEWFIPAPVVAELQEGATAAPAPARQLELNLKIDEMLADYSEALIAWDAESARIWGRLKHTEEVKRQPQALWDSLIDAMAVRLEATVATRNEQDFRHAKTFNPWGDGVAVA